MSLRQRSLENYESRHGYGSNKGYGQEQKGYGESQYQSNNWQQAEPKGKGKGKQKTGKRDDSPIRLPLDKSRKIARASPNAPPSTLPSSDPVGTARAGAAGNPGGRPGDTRNPRGINKWTMLHCVTISVWRKVLLYITWLV
jgi:hypothetical protein